MKSGDSSKSGFSLIEVTLAMGVAVFCLLTVFGLLPIGITTNQNASEQTAAAGVATAISADLHGNLVIGGTTSRFGLQIPGAGSQSTSAAPGKQTLFFGADGNISQTGTPAAGTTAISSGSDPSRYRATVTMTAVSTTNTPLAKVFNTRIFITWPALGDGNSNTDAAHFAGTYETFTTLNCN